MGSGGCVARISTAKSCMMSATSVWLITGGVVFPFGVGVGALLVNRQSIVTLNRPSGIRHLLVDV